MPSSILVRLRTNVEGEFVDVPSHIIPGYDKDTVVSIHPMLSGSDAGIILRCNFISREEPFTVYSAGGLLLRRKEAEAPKENCVEFVVST